MSWAAAAAAAAQIGSNLYQNVSADKESTQAWRREMYASNTAYQRAASDLEKAGLNRILALGNPASTPNANVPPVTGAMEGASGAATAVVQAQQTKEATALLKDQQAQTQAATDVAITTQNLNRAATAKAEAERLNVLADTANKPFVQEELKARINDLVKAAALKQEQMGLTGYKASNEKLEYEKGRTTKGLYEAGGPVVEDAVKGAKTGYNSAKNAVRSGWHHVTDFFDDYKHYWSAKEAAK